MSYTLLPSYHRDWQKEIIFKLKGQQLLLLTLSFLNLTQPHIYVSDLRCPVCMDQKETWSHVYLCTSQLSSIQTCVDLTINFIEEKLEKHVLDLPDFMQELKDLPIWIILTSLEENAGSRNPDFMDFIRGFVPYNLKFFFKQHLPSTYQSESITE